MEKTLEFMHALNDGGLLFLNRYLEERCGCRVFHISPSDRLICREEDRAAFTPLKERLSARSFDDPLTYDASEQCLIYQLTINEYRQQLVFLPLDEEGCAVVRRELRRILEPLIYYLKGLYFSFEQCRSLLENDPERIFVRDNGYWCRILTRRMISPEARLGTILITPPVGFEAGMDRLRRFVTNLYLYDAGLDIMSYVYRDRLILIVPEHVRVLLHSPAGRSEGGAIYPERYLEALNERFGSGFRITVGPLVPAPRYYDSYIAAMAACYYLEYFRKPESIFSFERIGPAGHLIRSGLEERYAEIKGRYDALKRYESDRSGNLLSTLRELVRCQFSYQEAAKALFIHQNTLYYRVDKLNDLLRLDMNQLESRIRLFVELFTYDLVEQLNLPGRAGA